MMSRFIRSLMTISLAIILIVFLISLIYIKYFYPYSFGDLVWKLFFLVVVPLIILISVLILYSRNS